MEPSHWSFSWLLTRHHKGGAEEILASGHSATIAAARIAIVDAEKAFPVAWLPEVHYTIRDAAGMDQEEGGVCWLPVGSTVRGRDD